jgi:hypothetical protein
MNNLEKVAPVSAGGELLPCGVRQVIGNDHLAAA